MAKERICETCGVVIEGKGCAARFCKACLIKRRREQARQIEKERRAKIHQENRERARAAEREAFRPKLSIADIAIYAKEHGITYGKAVMELEGRRGK